MTDRRWWLALLAGLLLMHGLSLGLRPILPVDETRYLGVAWEMWRDHSFLVPVSNGEWYTHKPPLLFWLIHAGWAVCGVNDVTPRLLLPLLSLAALLGLREVARRLWPDQADVGRWAALLLLASSYFAAYQTALMFDVLLLVTLVWSCWALLAAVQDGRGRYWLAFGLLQGLGLLSKGPVVWIYTLPLLVGWRLWAGGKPGSMRWPWLALALLVMLALPGLWLFLAWQQGASTDYFQHLVVQQVMDRIEGDLGHPRPLYWYLPVLLAVTLPWWLWPPVWRAITRLRAAWSDAGIRWLAIAMGCAFVLLSAMDSKQAHYLIPLLAMAALVLARLLVLAQPAWQPRMLWRCVVISVGGLALLYGGAFQHFAERYRIDAAAAYVGAQQQQGRPVAVLGHYHNEFAFYGRLQAPVASIWPLQVPAWMQVNPNGLLVVREQRITAGTRPAQPEFAQDYRGSRLLMLGVPELLASGAGFQEGGSE